MTKRDSNGHTADGQLHSGTISYLAGPLVGTSGDGADKSTPGLPPLNEGWRWVVDWKGIDPDVLGAALVTERRGLIRIPYLNPDASLCREKLIWRTPGRNPWWGEPKEAAIIPLGLETLPPVEERHCWVLLVAEGDSDTLACRSAYRGVPDGSRFHGVAVIGLPSATIWKPEWAKHVSPFGRVFVLGDGDRPGRAMNQKVVRDVPDAIPVRLPDGRDARSIYLHGGRDALDRHLKRAEDDARRRRARLSPRPQPPWEQFL